MSSPPWNDTSTSCEKKDDSKRHSKGDDKRGTVARMRSPGPPVALWWWEWQLHIQRKQWRTLYILCHCMAMSSHCGCKETYNKEDYNKFEIRWICDIRVERKTSILDISKLKYCWYWVDRIEIYERKFNKLKKKTHTHTKMDGGWIVPYL